MLNTQNINRDKKRTNLLTLFDPYPELAEAWLVTGEDESDASRVSEKLMLTAGQDNSSTTSSVLWLHTRR